MKTNRWMGASNPNSKLTEEQVRAIRKEYIPYVMSSYKLAKKYNVGQTAIMEIIKNKKWTAV